MTSTQIIVTLAGLGFIAWTIWYFWLWKKEGIRAAVSGGVQEVMIKVKDGYTPDVVVVKAGVPVRLNFNRQETATCSERVVFPDFNKSAFLPPGEIVSIEITPEKPGEYDFSCHMGMLKGKLIAE
jgi:plastocyanin domain-containing protein